MLLETLLSYIIVLLALTLIIGVINIYYFLDYVLQKENRKKIFKVWLLGLFGLVVHSTGHTTEVMLESTKIPAILEMASLMIAVVAVITLARSTLSFHTIQMTKRRLETARTEAEEGYRMLFENSLDGIYRSTAGGKFIDVNPALVKMFGYESREELLSVDIPHDVYTSEADRPTKDERGTVHLNRVRRKDGTQIWIESSSRVISNHNGSSVYEGIVRDITDRIRTEEKLQKKIDELEKWQRLTTGREIKMTELKKEIKELKKRLEKYEKPVTGQPLI
jgi:PAS domain S-box-containing protein